ncbi:MAG TPA: c-type cytochrome [Methylomirabilota bacterium]|nr:c-type cytochrome [Methylomirabilota bacterium]
MFRRVISYSIALLTCAALTLFAADEEKSAAMAKGKLLYLQHCVICHQGSGQGTPGTFPPLAKSDYLMAKPENGIRPIVEGLSGRITVNGSNYNNTMPPILITDEQVAAVLTFVRNTWGNEGEAITAAQVQAVRSKSRFATYEALKAAANYAPLPQAPDGFSIREVIRFTENAVRLALKPGSDDVFVLSEPGNIWRVGRNAALQQVLRGEQYLEPKRGHAGTLGFTFDQTGRLFITSNRRLDTRPFVTNEVTIYRSTSAGAPFAVEPYVRLRYPWGIGPFNHGVSHIAQGPDGFLYVTSGSRTDGNEPGKDPRYFGGGELDMTACIWRLPTDGAREPEIFARGLRNSFGFCWDDRAAMFATDNGPDADMPEELNVIDRGHHYGFPFRFGASANKPYAYTPDAPIEVSFTRPVANLGPDGGFQATALATFAPHSSPAGMIFCGPEFPESVRGTFLVTRFGNLLKSDKDVGFDLLQMRVKKTAAGYEAETKTWLAPLARPIDVVAVDGKIYVLEYSRPLNHKGDVPMLPGRLLELKPSN